MEDREACQALISIVLENEIELLERPQTEKELRVSLQLRQVRLDVVSMDDEKKLYHTEMQKENTGNLIKRSRYYQAQLETSTILPICELVEEFAPEYDSEKVYEKYCATFPCFNSFQL